MASVRQGAPSARWPGLVRSTLEMAADEEPSEPRRIDDFIAKAAMDVDRVRHAARSTREQLGRLHAEAVSALTPARPVLDAAPDARIASITPHHLDIVR
ncbi:MAG: hypothetical protein HYR75_03750 [Gemmatimonadetes bacterium]|nr:hypothetical protein [Gemmatimonadota bacterium]MBI3568292.1 hypothetical protein [Gemmatimonadota bacterium]